jgi:hypothetical protein
MNYFSVSILTARSKAATFNTLPRTSARIVGSNGNHFVEVTRSLFSKTRGFDGHLVEMDVVEIVGRRPSRR